MTSHNCKTCRYVACKGECGCKGDCARRTAMRYPGNDPENGPAVLHAKCECGQWYAIEDEDGQAIEGAACACKSPPMTDEEMRAAYEEAAIYDAECARCAVRALNKAHDAVIDNQIALLHD